MNEHDVVCKIKDAVKQIHVPQQMQEMVIQNIGRRMNPARHRAGKRKLAMTAAIVITLLGIGSLPVQALVKYYRNAYENPHIRLRVELTMSAEEIQKLFRMFDIQDGNGVNADSYSRDFIGTESARLQKLWGEYTQGVSFPQGSIPMVNSEEEAKKYDFCYLAPFAKYCFPQDRELTDEELLQMIELQLKCAYVIEKRFFEQ